MSLPFPVDTSTQLTYSTFGFATPPLDNYATSNFVSNVSNVLRTAINTKQDTLTAATTLLGVGTSITAIDYTKVSVNKPTNFQADWNSTVINKPSTFPVDTTVYYNKTETNNLLNAKQASISTYTITGATGGSFGFSTGTLTIGMPTNYTASMSLSNLITPTSFIYKGTELSTTLATKQNNLTFSSPLVNTANTITFNESAITTLTNFYNKTEANSLLNAKQATLTFSSPLVNTANTISINLGAYSTTGNDTNYLLKSGGTMTGALTTPNITLGGTSGKINVVDDYHYIDFNQSIDTTTIQEYGTIKFNIGPTKTTKAYVNSTGLIATAFYGDGANITNVPYSTITGKPTNFQADWNTTIINKPSTFPVDTTIYYNKTETNNLLNAKQATLTFSSPLVNTTNTITFNESAITTLTNFYNKTEANTLLNAKQATLTFSSPLVNTTNTITFNESAITTLTNFYNKTGSDARYLQLTGGSLSGTLNIQTGTSVIHFGTRLIDNLLTLWGDGTSTYGIGINNATLRYNVPTNTTHRFYTGTTNTVTIDGSGNVGIGITNPFASLSIGTPALTSDGTLTISRNSGGNRNFKFGYDGGFNFCMGDFGNGVSANTWRPTDLTINWQTANVGIGISGQSQKLYVNGSSYINGASTINGTLTAQVLNLNTSASGNNVLFIRSANSGANNCIQIQNDLNRTAYIGYGGSTFAGGGNNYVNNLFIENANGAIILNSQGRTSTSTPNFLIRTDGHIETSGYVIAGTNGATANGLRIGGWDTGNTLYQDSTAVGANMGFTLRNANSFNFTSYSTAGVYTTMLTINTTGIKIPLADFTFAIRDWYLYQGMAAGTITNSLIFWHSAAGFNSRWWFNGQQTATNSEISDERIKKEIKEIETPLNKIMSLKPKEYYLCDDKDYNKKFGIIAQDVEQIFPEFIHTENNYIANIFSCATYDNNIITIDKDISNLINIDDELKLIFNNNNKNNLEIIIDDTPYNNRYKRRFVKVVEIIDNHSFKINIELNDLFEDSSITNNIFIYGKKVDNFKRLDYESLYCLNIAATQELYKLIEQLQNRISILEARLN